MTSVLKIPQERYNFDVYHDKNIQKCKMINADIFGRFLFALKI